MASLRSFVGSIQKQAIDIYNSQTIVQCSQQISMAFVEDHTWLGNFHDDNLLSCPFGYSIFRLSMCCYKMSDTSATFFAKEQS